MADNWGMLPQFNSIAGYGYGSSNVPAMGEGITSMGGAYGGMVPTSELVQGSGIAQGSGGGMFDWLKNSGFTGSTDTKTGIKTDGWGGMALGAAQGLGSAYMGMKQFGLAKQQLAFQKDTFNKNYAAQRQATNTGLEDRQNARVASNSGAYQSVGDYMNQNRIR